MPKLAGLPKPWVKEVFMFSILFKAQRFFMLDKYIQKVKTTSVSSTTVKHVTTTLFTVRNAGINIFGHGIAWLTVRVSHTKTLFAYRRYFVTHIIRALCYGRTFFISFATPFYASIGKNSFGIDKNCSSPLQNCLCIHVNADTPQAVIMRQASISK